MLKKTNKIEVERAAYFQEAIREHDGQPLDMDTIRSLIQVYVIY
jgi:translation machinery-associated protein 16